MSRTPRFANGPSAPAVSRVSDGAIHCADCAHCKVFKEFSRTGTYIQKVRCAEGHWLRYKHIHLEATHPLHTLLRRVVAECPDYVSTSEDDADRAQYLTALAEDLPVEKFVYGRDGAIVMRGE